MSEEEQAVQTLDQFVLPVLIAGAELAERQEHIRRLEPGDELVLEREAGSERGENAVRVLDTHGNMLGYIPERLSEQVAALLGEEETGPPAVRTIVNRLVAMDADGEVLGAEILVFYQPNQAEDPTEGSELSARNSLRRAVIAVISVIVIVTLLALVLLGSWRVVPRQRQVPQPPIYALACEARTASPSRAA